MRISRVVIFAMIAALPLSGNADVSGSDFPDNTDWYVHVDLKAMRESESGKTLYALLSGEVVAKAYEEVGIDINKEVDSITAYADAGVSAALIFEGSISKETQDKMLEIASAEANVDARRHKGKEYYFIGDESEPEPSGKISLVDIEDASYSSFAIKNKLIVTASEEYIKALLDNGGKAAASNSHDGAIFVLSADRSMVQAGARTDAMSDYDDDWQSNILRNTEQAALVISDESGMIAIEALLVSADPQMAKGMGDIVNGLLALQMFNSDIPPGYRGILKNINVDVDDKTLSISIAVDPDMLISILND